jgi:uncharacterized membrane protein
MPKLRRASRPRLKKLRTRPRSWREILAPRFSRVGLLVALLFVSLSLVPSLLPRTSVMQGIVTGVAVALGYGVGVAARGLWRFFELPILPTRVRRPAALGALAALLWLLAYTLWHYVGWQNEVRELFGMPTVGSGVWFRIIAAAILTAVTLLVVARTLRVIWRKIADALSRFLPRRLAIAMGATLSFLAVWGLVTGVLVNAFFVGANWLFSPVDLATAPRVHEATSVFRSGSPRSLVEWDSLGRQGRNFVAGGPSVGDLNAFHGGTDAKMPIRVYVGLRSAETPEDRTELLLDELIRTGAFEREALMIAITTGTGWLDANAMSTFEYMFNGDTAIAGAQYSYLPSWISTMADQEVVRTESLALFRAVQDHWSRLDPETRPDIYLFGLSLGSYGVEAILRSPSIINDPIAGALMAGPTFLNPMHAELTAGRDPGSSAALPLFDSGRTVRFTGENDNLRRGLATWGPSRVVYLQHGSDPVTFFSPELAWSRPAWLDNGYRAPDVSKEMGWAPVITMWQVAVDLVGADGVPVGYGHKYSAQAFAQSWAGVMGADAWDQQRVEELVEFMNSEQRGIR